MTRLCWLTPDGCLLIDDGPSTDRKGIDDKRRAVEDARRYVLLDAAGQVRAIYQVRLADAQEELYATVYRVEGDALAAYESCHVDSCDKNPSCSRKVVIAGLRAIDASADPRAAQLESALASHAAAQAGLRQQALVNQAAEQREHARQLDRFDAAVAALPASEPIDLVFRYGKRWLGGADTSSVLITLRSGQIVFKYSPCRLYGLRLKEELSDRLKGRYGDRFRSFEADLPTCAEGMAFYPD